MGLQHQQYLPQSQQQPDTLNGTILGTQGSYLHKVCKIQLVDNRRPSLQTLCLDLSNSDMSQLALMSLLQQQQQQQQQQQSSSLAGLDSSVEENIFQRLQFQEACNLV